MEIPEEAFLVPVNRVLADNGRRVVLAYVGLGGVLAYVSGYLEGEWLLTSLLLLSGALMLGLLRLWLCWRFDTDNPRAWRRQYSLVTLLNVIAWSVLAGAVMFHQGVNHITFIWLMTTAGLVAGGVASMSVLPSLAISYQTILLLPIAVLWWFRPESELNAVAFFTLIFWGQMLALSMQQARHHKASLRDKMMLESHAAKLKTASEQDALTGLANRRHFEAILSQEWNRLHRSYGHLAVLMIDLDHFKSINDTYGHQIGDKCLCRVALSLREFIRRPADLLARYGGEEFIILLPDTELEGAAAVAQTLCEAMARRPLRIVEHQIPVTLSIGVAAVRPVDEGSREQLLKRADSALYRAKQKGRNRVVCDYAERDIVSVTEHLETA
ncbi:hypothetical protein R50073_32420 [Maricurvus nonylphenolicus]|uniref:GGDEF domain-containing protein n=1 Tax=Maricurvus nonylphenolicus TaxID=1008307 RepID=UPI0036F3CA16